MKKITWALALALCLVIANGVTSSAQSLDSLRERANQGTIAIISGGVNGTYIRIASDLATVLDTENKLRVLPIVGKGSLQNIADLLYLRGIDFAIVQSDVLGFILKERLFPNIEQRVRYVTKLYNEEVHILAAADIQKLADLSGKKVNVDGVGSGTAMTAATLFSGVLNARGKFFVAAAAPILLNLCLLLAVFPFRDDTLLLWAAVKRYVSAYLRIYYTSDQDVREDSELQGWIHELTSPLYCGFKGLGGLVPAAIVARLKQETRPGDVVIVFSNGGFDGIHDKLLAALQA